MTDELIMRGFAPELEIRAAAKGGDGRVVEGLAVPFGKAQRISADLTEQFARGSFSHQLGAPNRVKFLRDHGVLIGRAVELRDDAAGLWGAWRVSATQTGDETLELLRDGALDELSVGFRRRQHRRLVDGTIERVKVDLVEVSVVMEGAYGREALVSAVRESQRGCTCGAVGGLAEARQILAGLPLLPSAA